ncbi:MAG: N-6 DNA methylase [Candidatus Pacebacteria bacterium]|nr:N-6 DNA methylase [Candidatus Paceibacterota bacterium]NUQ57100.1 N-6 DNA methylase [Candidatus Paceibacter sp.]
MLFPELEQISKDDLKKAENLFKVFGDIHNHIYANDGLSSQEAFAEVLKLLFIKVEDERGDEKKSKFYISEVEKDEISDGRDDTFRKRIVELFDKAKKDYDDVFDESEKINLKTATLAFVVSKLQNLNLSRSERDVKGTAFQKFVYSHQRGERGQFFTPDPIIRLCVEFLSPQKNEKVLDPACGTGGFLVEAMKYVWQNNFANIKDSEQRKKKEMEYAENHLFGIEINPLVAKVAKMRMILEDDGYSGIVNTNSLSNIHAIQKEFSKSTKLNKIEGSFDLILTNPPFGSQGKVTNENVLRDFSLGYKWSKDSRGKLVATNQLQNGQVPEILFIERCLGLLKDGGKLAIVLPNGDFENSSLDYVREFINSKAKILAVVALPPETFIPHGTGVKASLLFCQKLSPVELEAQKKKDYSIFFAKITKVGYEGNKNGTIIYKKDSQGRVVENQDGDPIIDEDISEIISAYSQFRESKKIKANNNIFTLQYSELNNRFDVEYYNPEYRKIRTLLSKGGAKKLGELVEVVTRKSKRLKTPEAVIRYVELSDASSINGELVSYSEMQVHEAPSRASYEIEEGDIITAVAGNSIGTKNHATAIVRRDFSGAICTNGFRVLKANSINPYYLFAILRSDIFLSQIFRLRTGAAIPSVSDEDLKNILIPIPPETEQKKIEKTIREGLELREKSRQLLDGISLEAYILK